jgi:hypothetical protein
MLRLGQGIEKFGRAKFRWCDSGTWIDSPVFVRPFLFLVASHLR